MNTNTAALADAYAALKLEEERVKVRVSSLREEILQVGEKQIVGDVCIVEVVEKKGAETIDKAAVLALLKTLGATADQIASVTKTGKPTKSLLVKPNLALAI